MTLDEKIQNVREIAEKNRSDYKNCPKHREDIKYQTCEECAEEHEQIAEWLEELKFIREWKSDVMESLCKYDCNSVEEVAHNAYNRAIYDFEKALCMNETIDKSVVRRVSIQLQKGGAE